MRADVRWKNGNIWCHAWEQFRKDHEGKIYWYASAALQVRRGSSEPHAVLVWKGNDTTLDFYSGTGAVSIDIGINAVPEASREAWGKFLAQMGPGIVKKDCRSKIKEFAHEVGEDSRRTLDLQSDLEFVRAENETLRGERDRAVRNYESMDKQAAQANERADEAEGRATMHCMRIIAALAEDEVLTEGTTMADWTRNLEATCETCPFRSRVTSSRKYFRCKRFAPRPLMDGGGDGWPTVPAAQWCGEHPDFRLENESGT